MTTDSTATNTLAAKKKKKLVKRGLSLEVSESHGVDPAPGLNTPSALAVPLQMPWDKTGHGDGGRDNGAGKGKKINKKSGLARRALSLDVDEGHGVDPAPGLNTPSAHAVALQMPWDTEHTSSNVRTSKGSFGLKRGLSSKLKVINDGHGVDPSPGLNTPSAQAVPLQLPWDEEHQTFNSASQSRAKPSLSTDEITARREHNIALKEERSQQVGTVRILERVEKQRQSLCEKESQLEESRHRWRAEEEARRAQQKQEMATEQQRQQRRDEGIEKRALQREMREAERARQIKAAAKREAEERDARVASSRQRRRQQLEAAAPVKQWVGYAPT